MKSFALLSLLVVSATAGEILQETLVEPLPQYTQEQNTATGEYGYSYSGGPSAKTEFRAQDGTTTGTYSYVDAHGILQTVNYIADEFGFRVAGSNVPTDGLSPLDAPDVAVAKAAHLAEHSRQSLNALSRQRRKRSVYAEPILASHTLVEHLPVATSHQSRFQIHNDAKIIQQVHTPIVGHAPLFLRKKRGIIAEALPPTTAKIYDEFARKPIVAAPATYLAPSAPLYAPAAVEVRSAVPAFTTTSYTQHLPVATSSQSRFQVHKGAKIIEQTQLPIYAPVAAAIPAAFPAYPAYPAYPAALPAAPAYPAAAAAPIAPAYPAEAVIADSDAITVDSV